MSVVMVTDRREGARWEGYHGADLLPPRLVGIVAATTGVRLVTIVAVLCRGHRGSSGADAVAGETEQWERHFGGARGWPGVADRAARCRWSHIGRAGA